MRTFMVLASLLLLAAVWIFSWRMDNLHKASEPPLVKTLEEVWKK